MWVLRYLNSHRGMKKRCFLLAPENDDELGNIWVHSLVHPTMHVRIFFRLPWWLTLKLGPKKPYDIGSGSKAEAVAIGNRIPISGFFINPHQCPDR